MNTAFRVVSMASITALASVVGCSSTGTGEIEGQLGPVRGKVTVDFAPAPDKEGKKVGTWTDDDGTTYELYDLDGDGEPDIAKGPDGKWYVIKEIILIPIELPNKDGDVKLNKQSVSQTLGASPNESRYVISFTDGSSLELNRLTIQSLGGTFDVNGDAWVSARKIASGYTFGPGSDLDGVFDFTGSSADDLLDLYGWSGAEQGDVIELDSYGDAELYAGQIVEASFVVGTQQQFPNMATIDVEVAVVPVEDTGGTFRVYGLAARGHAVEMTEFAAGLGMSEISFTVDGVEIVTTIDVSTRTATATANGVVFDTYTY